VSRRNAFGLGAVLIVLGVVLGVVLVSSMGGAIFIPMALALILAGIGTMLVGTASRR
jgi:hypothetical protein